MKEDETTTIISRPLGVKSTFFVGVHSVLREMLVATIKALIPARGRPKTKG